jgi:serine/threonine-protein kinase
MRFVKGESLESAIDRFHRGEPADPADRNLTFRQLLRRFTDVCNTIAYAHSRGVLHRDLKPANVMLGPYGETLLVDWGLAKSLGHRDARSAAAHDEGTLVLRSTSTMFLDLTEMMKHADEVPLASESHGTKAGTVLGTPAFMSPEQAAAQLDKVGPASDIYSLGAILYTLLAGRPPFQGSLADVLDDVEAGQFPRPRVFQPRVHPALEAICLKAMSLSPEERYPTGRELAHDVERWLADEPVSAYREPATATLRRWARKHQRLVLRSTAVLLAGVIGLSVALAIVINLNRRLASENQRLQRAAQELREGNAASSVKGARGAGVGP